MPKPTLSVIVVFYNMRREAKRTLFSLTSQYQRSICSDDYEVIAIDSNSSEPLSEADVTEFGANFRYYFFESDTQSPGPALNFGASVAAGDIVMCNIDGARILSPGILRYTLRAFDAFSDPFVYTLGMHLGHDVQNVSMLHGYNQEAEDQLLNSIEWRSNGYRLFNCSTLVPSNAAGYFSKSNESNCVALRRDSYLKLGGYDERFTLPGGGIVNLDFFNRLHESDKLEPVVLMGEATFHQFHGGVATNRPWDEHPWQQFKNEYLQLKGMPYQAVWRPPHCIGHIPEECKDMFDMSALAK